jgi:hypothetical protein
VSLSGTQGGADGVDTPLSDLKGNTESYLERVNRQSNLKLT